MSLSHLHKILFPYAIKLFEGNKIQFFNREYSPLGITIKDYQSDEVDNLTTMEVAPEAIKSLKKLAVPPFDDKFIFLYDDNSSPELSDEMSDRYREKIKQLISIDLTPPPIV